jgi:hypothetical protein
MARDSEQAIRARLDARAEHHANQDARDRASAEGEQ